MGTHLSICISHIHNHHYDLDTVPPQGHTVTVISRSVEVVILSFLILHCPFNIAIVFISTGLRKPLQSSGYHASCRNEFQDAKGCLRGFVRLEIKVTLNIKDASVIDFQ